MTDREIQGLGTENGDTVGAAVFGVLTVALDVLSLTRIRRWRCAMLSALGSHLLLPLGLLLALASRWGCPRWRRSGRQLLSDPP
ncbi:hypothetical protein [Kitasatospora aureofaciens]|uniref:hypothetical protein n=1 Tax=Kitasatospora aureofaciens TaxID=1894 RepID=UPI0036F4908D